MNSFRGIIPKFSARSEAKSKLLETSVGGTPTIAEERKRAHFEKTAAATKIQALKRGKDSRKSLAPTVQPVRPSLTRRVSFDAKGGIANFLLGGSGEATSSAGQLRDALASCLATMPCVADLADSRISRNSLPKDADLPRMSKYEEKEGDKEDVELSPAVLEKITALFTKLDENGDGSVSRAEAEAYWKKNWAKVNASAMFNEVDDDSNGCVPAARSRTAQRMYPHVCCLPCACARQRGHVPRVGGLLEERARAARVYGGGGVRGAG